MYGYILLYLQIHLLFYVIDPIYRRRISQLIYRSNDHHKIILHCAQPQVTTCMLGSCTYNVPEIYDRLGKYLLGLLPIIKSIISEAESHLLGDRLARCDQRGSASAFLAEASWFDHGYSSCKL